MKFKNFLDFFKRFAPYKNYIRAAVFIITILIVALFYVLKPNENIINAGQQVSILANNIQNFYKNKPNAWGLNTYSAIKNKIIPQDMLVDQQIKNALHKDVLLGADVLGNTVMPGSKTFTIVYKNLDYNECKILASFTFSEKIMLSLYSINIINDKTFTFGWEENSTLPVSLNDAASFCKKNNDILWNIYL